MANNVVPFPRPIANDDDQPTPPSPFIAALLAPLPDTEVPADSDEFRRQLKEDKRRPWRKAQMEVEAFEAAHQMRLKLLNYAYEFAPEYADARSDEYHEAKLTYMSFLHDLMMTPAPDDQAYRWKTERCHVGGRHNDWNEVLDADIARLQQRRAA